MTSVGLCKPVIYMCMWRLSGSQKFQQQQNFLCDFLFFQVTYQYLRLFTVLASYMTYSFSLRVLNLSELKEFVLLCSVPCYLQRSIIFVCSFLFLCSEACRNNALKQRTWCKIQVFYFVTAKGFCSLDYKNMYEIFFFIFIFIYSHEEKEGRY